MRDRVPSPGKENRVRITQDNGQIVEGVLSYADDATQEGSAYNKANVLPDDVCILLGIDPFTSEPKDAWFGVMQALGYAILSIKAVEMDGTPLTDFKVAGLTGVLEDKTYTDSNGEIWLIIQEGTYTLSVPDADCIDAKIPPQEVAVASGEQKQVVLQMQKTGITTKQFTSSEVVKFSGNLSGLDIFCVGGGGSGGYGGGGGGYTRTILNAAFTPYQECSVVVASGGSSTSNGIGMSGGSSSLLNCSAGGGSGGGSSSDVYIGGNGGSGGGGGENAYDAGGNGGSDGADGERGRRDGGSGQGTTTRAFGESGGTLYAGGGGGMGVPSGAGGAGGGGYGGRANSQGGSGSANTGGGGGGGTTSGNGGSGIVIVRWRYKV